MEKASDSRSSNIARYNSRASGKSPALHAKAIVATSSEVLDEAFISKILPEILIAMTKETKGDITVLRPFEVLMALDSALANRLSRELGRGVQFKPFNSVDAGFRISIENSAAHYDFSAESVAEILASRVNARLGECVKATLDKDKICESLLVFFGDPSGYYLERHRRCSAGISLLCQRNMSPEDCAEVAEAPAYLIGARAPESFRSDFFA